jgi:hypothetical protein
MTPKNGIVETTEPGAQAAATMASAGTDGFVKRFLASVPADVAPTFSRAQLLAVKEFVINKRDRQAVDIRWTIPLIWFRFFIVVLAGPERRSPERVAAERAARPILTWSNILVIVVFLVMLLTSLVGVNYAVTMAPVPGVN